MKKTLSRRDISLRTLRSLPVKKLHSARVLVRVDINAEIERGRVRDLTRFEAIRPTIEYICRHHGTVILVAHRGRPKGREKSLSLKPYLLPLKKVLGRPVQFIESDVWSHDIQNRLASVPTGAIALLENIRFEPGESKNDDRLAKRLAEFADIAVNDAFADSHRAHASIVGVAKYLPLYAGMLLEREITALTVALKNPKRPYVAVIGGAKISTKLHLVETLVKSADAVLLGGALANTVLKAEGVAIGASLIEPEMLAAAGTLRSTNAKLHIPIDVIVARKNGRPIRRAIGNVQSSERILDIGPDTIELFRRVLISAKTIVWNGPMGVYERRPFDRGTRAVARVVSTCRRAVTVAGGGETIDAIRAGKMDKYFTVISTGGGAMLEWLEGKSLPGILACTKG